MASESLRFINAIVGFCTPMGEWPHPLADLGYVACGVEREITVNLVGQPRKVVVDLICASPDLNHAMCAETKSRTVPMEQARKYGAMKSSDLVNFANLPDSMELSNVTHDVLYVADQDNSTVVALELRNAGHAFPVLSCSDTRFVLESGTITQAALQDELASGISVPADPDTWPLAFVPFLADASDAEIVTPVSQALMSLLVEGRDFTVDEIATTVLRNWAWYGPGHQQRFKKRFAALIDSARKRELHEYLARPDSSQRWTAIKGSLRQYQQAAKLAENVESFVTRIKGGAHVQSMLPEAFSLP